VLAAAVGAPAAGASGAAAVAGPAAAACQVGPVTGISACGGRNAEVEQAVDAQPGYACEEWTGCRGITFARSTDGGRTWDTPVSLPGTAGSNLSTRDPAAAAAPGGTVHAAFMLSRGGQYYPGGRRLVRPRARFTRSSSLIPPGPRNWGDRDLIAVGADGTVYLTWDYGPERTSITCICAGAGPEGGSGMQRR
jgi:hypothetical protein